MTDLVPASGTGAARRGIQSERIIPSWIPLFQGTQHVNYRSPDGHIHELWWSYPGGWQYCDLTSAIGGSLAAGRPVGYSFRDQSTQHVVYTVGDGFIHELWWDDTAGWHENDLTLSTHAPSMAGDAVAAYTLEDDGTQHVIYYGDNDGHVHELWWTIQTGWHPSDLTVRAGGPNAVDVPAGCALEADGTQHVFYRSADGHVNELKWENSAWTHLDLTAHVPGTPSAEGALSSYAYEPSGSLHVAFRGADGHVHELVKPAQGQWYQMDWTAGAPGQAPDVVGDPAAYAFEREGTRHVMYRSIDLHVNELWFFIDNQMIQHNDLTVQADGPVAAGSLAAYAYNDQNTQHVFYRTEPGHIHELWRDIHGWHDHDLFDVANSSPALAVSDPDAYLF